MTAITSHAPNGGGGDVGEKQDLLQWVNLTLMRGGQEPVTNVEAAMADGITLAKLAWVLVGEEPPRHILNPSLLTQRVEILQTCIAWLQEKGVPLPHIHVEDLASGDAQNGLVLCKALHTYAMSRSGSLGSPVTRKHSGTTQPTDPAGTVKDEVAILRWLGSVVEEDITSYEELCDGHILCKLFRKLAPGSLEEDLSQKSAQERLDLALAAAETHLSISCGPLDANKLAQRREDSHKLLSLLQRCQSVYKQLRRPEKERSPTSQVSPNSPLPSPEVDDRTAFGFVEQRDPKMMLHSERALDAAKSCTAPEPSLHGRSNSASAGSQQWANRVQRTHAAASEGRESSPPYAASKTGAPSSSLGGTKIYPLPYHPTPPPTAPTSGAKQHTPHSSYPSWGTSTQAKGNAGPFVSAQNKTVAWAASGNGVADGGRKEEEKHPEGLSNGKIDSGVLRQPLSSDPQPVQSQLLLRVEVMEKDLALVRERLDTEREQFLQKLQGMAAAEEKKRGEMEKEFKNLADVARQLSKHYDTCFVTLARQIAHVQDRLGMESEETISALVGDAGAEEGRPVDSKQLLQEISSLKEQIHTIITGPAGSLPSESGTRPSDSGSKESEEEHREGSGSSPPPSMMATPDISLQSAEGQQKKLFVRKGKKQEKKKEKPKSGVTISPSPSSSSLVELAHSANITRANHKKLSKFFGEDLPKVENLKTFLAGLGFPELLPKFTKEQVTLNELQLMTERHLIELGIPMGPRLAILSEIQSLESVSFED